MEAAGGVPFPCGFRWPLVATHDHGHFGTCGQMTRPIPATAVLILGVLLGRPALGQACSTSTVGVDTSRTNSSGFAIDGEALGQTFMAADTLIKSITVWRHAADDTNLAGMQLYITATDSTGRPIAPVLQRGPTVVVPYGDGIHHIEFRFAFDPPLALPARGLYFFAVQPDPCIGYFDMPVDTLNGYPDGRMWWTRRNRACDTLGPLSELPPEVDLIFTVEFCDVMTPTLRNSWGRLKVLYR